MPKLVVHGATLACSMGSFPSTLTVLPINGVSFGTFAPAATVQDMKPMVNMAPFGMCQSPLNPQVVAAKAAAAGTLTPQPCMPATSAPWSPAPRAWPSRGLVYRRRRCRPMRRRNPLQSHRRLRL